MVAQPRVATTDTTHTNERPHPTSTQHVVRAVESEEVRVASCRQRRLCQHTMLALPCKRRKETRPRMHRDGSSLVHCLGRIELSLQCSETLHIDASR